MTDNYDFDEIKKKVEERSNEAVRRVVTGEFLKEMRSKKELSLVQLGEGLSVSAHYLSAVERGVKSMSDYFIREIAKFYKVDETVIFNLLGRIPLLTIEELKETPQLNEMIINIFRNTKLDDDQKQQLIDNMYKLYEDYIKDI